LLFGFWRELFALGGALSVQPRRLPQFAAWARRFALAAFRRSANTRHLAPLVKPASTAFHQLLTEIGRPELLLRNGHYQFWTGVGAERRARAEALHMTQLGIKTAPVQRDVFDSVSATIGSARIAGLWFPETAHVLDPFEICRALVQAAVQRGATVHRAEVLEVATRSNGIAVLMDQGAVVASTVVVCAGPWSAPLLKTFGLRVPLAAARGYHVELPGHAAYANAPIVYMDQKIVVTPMSGRLRASSFIEFDAPEAPPDVRKPARLRRVLQELGYHIDAEGPSWYGSRPVLPDYLPAIGRAPGSHRLFYATGHQHLGLTLAPVTGDVVCDLVSEREPRQSIAAFDLRRFAQQ